MPFWVTLCGGGLALAMVAGLAYVKRRSGAHSSAEPTLAPETKRPIYLRPWFPVLCAFAFFLLLARAPLPFDVAWWRVADFHDPGNRRQRMADWMVYTGSLKGLSRAEVTARLGEAEFPNSSVPNADMVYVLGTARGWHRYGATESLVLRFDPNGKVSETRVDTQIYID